MQAILNPGNELMTASNNVFHSDTFSSAGSIGSTVSNGSAIVTGRWSIDAAGGKVTTFNANLTMININGSGYHIMQIANLTTSKVTIERNETAVVKGMADVSVNGSTKWSSTDVTILLPKLRAISIVLSGGAGTHFGNKPVYGIADVPEKTITASNILPEGNGAFGKFADKIKLPQLPNPFRY